MRYSYFMKQLVIIAHNLRSAHNVGSLLRTAEGMGVTELLLTGHTPFPPLATDDPRLPHEQIKLAKLINKTALGAETTQPWRRVADIDAVLADLTAGGYVIAGLEQADNSVALPSFQVPDKLAVILGREVEGIEPELLQHCSVTLEIPMFGQKESFNVVQAAAMLMYHWRFIALT